MNNIFNKTRSIFYYYKAIFDSICIPPSIYSFSWNERKTGARIQHFGFPNLPKLITCKSVTKKFHKINIEGNIFFVPTKLFRPGELEYIWAEIFTRFQDNPHCYECPGLQIQAGDFVLDAGACEGFFTLFALQKDASHIFAFEPEPKLANSLKETFKTNSKVSVIESALYSNSEKSVLSSGLEYGCTAKIDPNGEHKILTTSIDDFVAKYSIDRLDFIKMDIEDTEVQALQGSINTLLKLRPKLSIAVYHSYENAIQIKQFIQRHAPKYKVWFGGCYLHEKPARPYMLYAVPES